VSSLAWAPPLSLPGWARCAAARDRDAPQQNSRGYYGFCEVEPYSTIHTLHQLHRQNTCISHFESVWRRFAFEKIAVWPCVCVHLRCGDKPCMCPDRAEEKTGVTGSSYMMLDHHHHSVRHLRCGRHFLHVRRRRVGSSDRRASDPIGNPVCPNLLYRTCTCDAA
jgi:hypothetical protein